MFRLEIVPGIELGLLELHHAEHLFEAVDANRGHLGTWFPWVASTVEAQVTHDFIQSQLDAWAKGTGLCCGIFEGERIVGTIGCHGINPRMKHVEIGYWLTADVTGRGIMTCAVKAMIDYLVGQRGFHRIIIKARVDNTASIAVATRNGFVYEGTERDGMLLDGAFYDVVVYSLLASEWGIGETAADAD
jgi:ribosomal-protein-serine acetyltransferase